ncbi:MAG: helix-turn-helix domain-containing protein [Planctomycetaceae bacterium]|nr:helix-turn-helix domain-containing protein [Planctomycetaceae bacterium]
MASSSSFTLRGKSRDTYLELVMKFPLASIKNEMHLAAAQKVLDRLITRSTHDSGEATYIETLSDLIATYEDLHHPIPSASDAEMLRHLLDAQGISQIQLSRAAGIARSSISEVLAGKKPFSKQMIRKLADYFKIDPAILAGNF